MTAEFRRYTATEQSQAQADRHGVQLDTLLQMARQSALYTPHEEGKQGNRRYGRFVMQVEGLVVTWFGPLNGHDEFDTRSQEERRRDKERVEQVIALHFPRLT